MRLYRYLVASCFTELMALSVPASGQDVAVAEALFNRGLAEMQAGHYESGCPAIAESHHLDPHPGTLFTLAACEAMRGRIATAATRYGDYLALFEQLTPEQQARQGDRPKIAAAERAALASQVPELTLSLPPDAPPGTVVTRDGAVLARTALGIVIPADPGEHLVTVQVPGGPVTELPISLSKGEKKQITLPVRRANPSLTMASASEASTRARRDTAVSARRVGTYISGGIGLAGIIVGSIAGGMAIATKGVIEENCVDRACNAKGKEAADQNKAFGLASTIGFGVGIAGVGLTLGLLLTEPKAAKSVPKAGVAAPTSHLSHTKLSLVVASRPSGGLVALTGAW